MLNKVGIIKSLTFVSLIYCSDLTNVSVLQTIPRPFERDYAFE